MTTYYMMMAADWSIMKMIHCNLPADCNLPNGGYPVTESHPEQRCLFWCQDVVWQWEGVDAGNGNSPAEGKLGKFN